MDHFIQEKFRAAKVGEKVNKYGVKSFELEWQHENVPLCRASYAFLFNITKHQLDRCSAAKKTAGSDFVKTTRHKVWKDDHLHEFSFAETEQLFKKNIAGMNIVGKGTIIIN